MGDTITLSSSVEKLVQGIGFYKDEWEGGEMVLTGAIIDGKQYGTIVNVDEQKTQQLSEYYISQNYPNPFNGQTVINYYVPKTSAVKIIVYDILGRIVAKLVDDIKPPGKYESRFNANDLSSGIYVYRITANNYSQTKKMLLLK